MFFTFRVNFCQLGRTDTLLVVHFDPRNVSDRIWRFTMNPFSNLNVGNLQVGSVHHTVLLLVHSCMLLTSKQLTKMCTWFSKNSRSYFVVENIKDKALLSMVLSLFFGQSNIFFITLEYQCGRPASSAHDGSAPTRATAPEPAAAARAASAAVEATARRRSPPAARRAAAGATR